MPGFDLHSTSFCCLVYICVPRFAFLFFHFRKRINPATSFMTLVPALQINYGYRCPVAQHALSLMNRENVVQPSYFSVTCSFFTLAHVPQRYADCLCHFFFSASTMAPTKRLDLMQDKSPANAISSWN